MHTDQPDRHNGLASWWADEHGATAAEYALLAALIAAVIAGIVGFFGLEVRELFITVEDAFP